MTSSPREIKGAIESAEHFFQEIVAPCQPVVLRGLVGRWPSVQASAQSLRTFRDHLAQFDAGGSMEAFIGPPHIHGKYYYSDDLKGINFERRKMRLSAALDAMMANLDQPQAPTVYAGSLPIEDYLPGFSAQNPMPFLGASVSGRIWLGNASNVSAHYDTLDNLACVVAGARRFTLFAPELISKLYVGPIDHTLAGQPVSLAAASGDEQKFPLFKAAKDKALIAELQPGDALYLPKLWWHQVEATAPFNALMNYWWDAFSAGPDAPYTSLLLAMITIAERPAPERHAWRAFFDHYAFRPEGHPLAHLPAELHGILGPLRENYGKIRARIMHILRGG